MPTLRSLTMQCKPVLQLTLLTLNARVRCVSGHVSEISLISLEGLHLPPQGEKLTTYWHDLNIDFDFTLEREESSECHRQLVTVSSWA